jgi:hypothetical protein
MKKKPMQPNWVDLLADHREQCHSLSATLDQMEADRPAGTDLDRKLSQVKLTIQAICQRADLLHETMAIRPIRGMLLADRLHVTEQQYRLTRSAGFHNFTAKSLGACVIADFQAYRMRVCEDDKVVCFMHPNQTPPSEPQWADDLG